MSSNFVSIALGTSSTWIPSFAKAPWRPSRRAHGRKINRRRVSAFIDLPFNSIADVAVQLDEAPAWTLDQIAGLVFGGLLLTLYFSSSTVDQFVARAQRKELGLCEQCGGLYEMKTCPKDSCPYRSRGS